jgi:HEAT repeat protein
MLDPNILESIYNGLRSRNPDAMLRACREVSDHIDSMEPNEERVIADALTGSLYIDIADHPEFADAVDCAVDTLAKMGPDTVNVLIEGLTDTDLQVNFMIGRVLAKMGEPAVAVLKEMFRTAKDPYRRSLALFALSKIDTPVLLEIFPDVIAALDHENGELRDMAAQAIGRMIDCIGSACLEPDIVNLAFDKLMLRVSDPNPGARAKVVRSIGRLARAGYLDDVQKKRALDAVRGILGIDGMYEWDRAFVVRQEAEETYYYLTGKNAERHAACEYCGQ